MNNKIIKSLVIAGLVVSTQSASATETNKTFMKAQPVVRLPLEQTGLKERTVNKLPDGFGGTLTVAGFYGQSTNGTALGKYFGANSKNTMIVDRGALVAQDVQIGYMIHDSGSDAAFTAAQAMTLKFDPKTISYGADFVYYQDLSKILNGLYLKVNLPVVRVENDMKMTVAGTGDGCATKANFESFFKGTYTAATDAAAQSYLTKAKINGKQSKTGVEDIDVLLGYKFLNKEAYNMSLNVGLSIPTGNASTGEFVNEALVGTKHFGVGGGLDAQARIWGDADHNVKFNVTANYRYMFQATEARCPGIKTWNMGQYVGLATIHGGVQTAVTPAANVLTGNYDVTPGSQIDALADINYNKGGFNIGLGYNLYYKEGESLKRKTTWSDAAYGIHDRTTATNLAITAVDFYNDDYLKTADLDTAAASTPSQLTHGVYGGVNYAFKDWEYPLLVGVGGKYEFASKNSAVEGWQAWVKAGLSF